MHAGAVQKEGEALSGTVLQGLAEDYPQLYMNPDQFSQEDDQSVVRRGEDPPVRSRAHYQGDPGGRPGYCKIGEMPSRAKER